MASTEQKAGFRLPWGGSAPADAPETETQAEDGSPQADQEGTEMSIATADPTQAQAATETVPADAATPAPAPEAPAAAVPVAGAPRKPARFMTELVRAMRAELEKHRDTTLDEFRVEAKNHVEGVHKRSAEEVTELRRIADEDIAGVREWSKAEIARIRSETEERIETRKGELESHLEEHAALIEREIEKVQARVTAYEAEIDAFFASLAQIEDPAAFAAAAQQVPDPPSLEAAGAEARSEALADLIRAESAAPEAAPVATAEAEAPQAEASATDVEPAPAVEVEANTEGTAEASADETAPVDPGDPRFAALALSEDLAAAESQAAVDAASSVTDESEEVPESEADIVAARLSGLVPEHVGAIQRAAPPDDMVSTQVIVTGLVSVASIASFKRHLSRLSGVNSVGVSSGPDGEFIFKANHTAGTNLKDLLPTISGYSVRVTSVGDGIINVSARDPEN
ncbi:MAG TPA: hypothetical protein VMH24_01380 [Candidatus Sulfotelmatobacter sp.]|nr:hypothetical protein [Candidatus Sulfotelmatobacter sp.]